MSQIRISFLGTSASAPTPERGLPAVFLEFKGQGFLFDVGEGTQRQFMRFGRSIMKTKHIFISHYHGDHIFGLPGFLSTLNLYNRRHPIHIWAPSKQIPHIERFMDIASSRFGYDVYYHAVEEGELLSAEDFTIRAYPLDHTVDCFAYVFEEAERVKADKERVRELGIEGPLVKELKAGKPVFWKGRTVNPEELVYRLPGRKIVYATDTRPIIHDYARGARILIHDATFSHSDQHLAVEKKHSTAVEAAELAKALGVHSLALFHFSSRIRDTSTLEVEARATFDRSFAVYDGQSLEI